MIIDIVTRAGDKFPIPFTVADMGKEDEPLIFINQHFLKLIGLEKEQVLGRNCRFLQGKATDRNVTKAIRQSLHKRECCYYDLINYHYKNGPFWNRLVLIPFGTEVEEDRYFIGIQQDVTAQKEKSMETPLTEYIAKGGNSQEIAHRVANPLTHILNEIRAEGLFYDGSLESEKKLDQLGKLIASEIEQICQYVRSLD